MGDRGSGVPVVRITAYQDRKHGRYYYYNNVIKMYVFKHLRTTRLETLQLLRE